MRGVIWTQVGGPPQKMGDLIYLNGETLFDYVADYPEHLPGLSLISDQRLANGKTVYYPGSDAIPFHPRLMSLIPGSGPRNLQRKHVLELIKQSQTKVAPPGPALEWQLLCAGGHGGVGHLDVFVDDRAAMAWYETRSVAPSATSPWQLVRRDVLDEPVDLPTNQLLELVGPTPSIGGMIPKLLATIDPDAAEQGEIIFSPDGIDCILKFEPPEYAGLLSLEYLALQVHDEAGFDAPKHYWQLQHKNIKVLAIERFDTNHQPLESLFSIIATGDRETTSREDVLLEDLPEIFSRLRQVIHLPPNTEEELYRRIIMAWLTGNGDLHLENLSFIGGLDNAQLSPVYDPPPMRAWPRHDMVSAIPMDPGSAGGVAQVFLNLGEAFGLSQDLINNSLQLATDAAQTLSAQLHDKTDLPQTQKDHLSSVIDAEQKKLHAVR